MRDPSRIDPIIEQVRALWKAHPDWRLGQIIANAVAETGQIDWDPFYIEDDLMLEGLQRLASRL